MMKPTHHVDNHADSVDDDDDNDKKGRDEKEEFHLPRLGIRHCCWVFFSFFLSSVWCVNRNHFTREAIEDGGR